MYVTLRELHAVLRWQILTLRNILHVRIVFARNILELL